LKAVIAEFRHASAIPYSHDLEDLAIFAGVPVPDEALEFLKLLSPHGVAARYLRNSEYDVAQVAYFIEKADETVIWLRQLLS
jgi:HEPN domain-containing protein